MGVFWGDLRYGIRTLLKSPGFAAVAVLTLALGIGLNSAIFSVVHAVVLNPLPYRQPDRLVALQNRDTRTGAVYSSYSYPDFLDIRAQNQVFDGVGVYTGNDVTLTGMGRPQIVHAATVSPDLIATLGIAPLLGSNKFVAVSGTRSSAGAADVIISERFWRSALDRDPNVLARSLTFDGKPYNIIGVMPARFDFPLQADRVEAWFSISSMMQTYDNSSPMTDNRGDHFLTVLARLKPGASLRSAQSNLEAIGVALEKQYSDSNSHRSFTASDLKAEWVGDTRGRLLILFGAVGFLLVMACANVANLLLSRATTRGREMAVRTALGAGRARIVRQLLTESVLLAIAGGAVGLLLFFWTQAVLSRLAPASIPRIEQMSVNAWVLVFTAGVSLLTGIVFGLAPALHVARPDVAETLKEGGRTAASASHNRLRGTLMVAQFGIAVVLLIGAGLLIRSLARLQSVNPGFHPEHVLAVEVGLPDAKYNAQQDYEFFDQLQTRLNALPGVRGSSGVFPLPLSDNNMDVSFDVEGHPLPEGERPGTFTRVVEPGYFETMGIPLVRGRDFTRADQHGSTPVIIVNQTFAHQVFSGAEALGKHINVGISAFPDELKTPMREIVGVVGDVHHRSLTRESGLEVYIPQAQVPFDQLSVVVRSDGDPRNLATAVRDQVNDLDSQLAVYKTFPMEHYVATSLAEPRLDTVLLGTFAAVALLLTAIGLFGMMAYNVAQRTHEIGLRMALGAQPTDVMRQIIAHGARLALIGLAVGLPAAFALTRLMESLLFGVRASDPPTFVGVALLLAGVSLAACYLPARRAMQVDPMVALRYE